MGEPRPADLEFRVLGPFEVAAAGLLLDIASAKQRLLLAMLVMAAGRPVPAAALADELWGAQPTVDVATGLQSLVSKVRRVLAPHGAVIAARSGGYALDRPAESSDAERFERRAALARDRAAAGDPEAAAGLFRAALSLWRGRAYDDFHDRECVRVEAARLNEARVATTGSLADVLLAASRPDEAVAVLEPLVATEPFREDACGRLMLAYYRGGRQADALRAYRDLRRALADELGLEPGAPLRLLERQILEHSPELDLSRRAGQAAPAASATTVVRAFLFTAIEASARTWDGDRAAMAADLERHDTLLVAAVEANGGRVMSHTGDGLCAEFATATAALTAAAQGQSALHTEKWAGRAGVRVRMAVHAGDAQARSGTYFGPALNRTARMLELAAGGQVLCSQAAADLAWDSLSDGLALVDLGWHPLPDLARPERVYHLVHPALPSEFPGIRVLATSQNLPSPVDEFLGRWDELAELTAMLEVHRLITVWGPGGAGKTRLTLELARRNLGHFRDGVWFVELAPIADPAGVAPAVMAALGMAAGGSGVPLGSLVRYLSNRQTLVVLDNCEHVVDGAAAVARSVLARCPHIRLLASSREPLGIAGEHVWSARSLTLPDPDCPPGALPDSDAVALFCARAAAAQPGFRLTPANAPAVAEICRRLEGLPLALELAAARVRVLGVKGVADRLDDKLGLLAGGARSADPRHQTMRAAVEWSVDLLPEAERDLLARLSIFVSSFDLTAAEAVGGSGGPGVLDLLARLVDRSLVTAAHHDGAVRYRLLETVRQHAMEIHVACDGADHGVSATRRRYLDHYLAAIPSWETRSMYSHGWMWSAIREDANLRAALEIAIEDVDQAAALRLGGSLWWCWLWAGSPMDAPRRWLQRAVALPGGAPPADLAFARMALAVGAASSDPVGEALSSVRRTGDLGALAWSCVVAAEVFAGFGKHDEARRVATECVDLAEAHGFAVPGAWCSGHLAWSALISGDPRAAQGWAARAFALLKANAEGVVQSHLQAVLAVAHAALGEHDGAERAADESVRLARAIPLPGFTVMALTRAAEAAVLASRWPRATHLLRENLLLLRRLGSDRWVGDVLELAGLLLGARGYPEASHAVLASASAHRARRGELTGGGHPALLSRLVACDAPPERTADFVRIPPPSTDEALVFALEALATLDDGQANA